MVVNGINIYLSTQAMNLEFISGTSSPFPQKNKIKIFKISSPANEPS